MSSPPYDIDNDDNLFSFDPYDVDPSRVHESSGPRPFASADSMDSAAPMSSHDAAFTSGELDHQPDMTSSPSGKGKQVSMPMPIRSSTIIHDLFDVSPSIAGARASTSFAASDFSSFSPSSFTFSSPASSTGSCSLRPITFSPLLGVMGSGSFGEGSPSVTSDFSRKGKARELPPTLPPLTFCPSEIGNEQSTWLSSDDSSQFVGTSYHVSGPYSAVSGAVPVTPSQTDTGPASPVSAAEGTTSSPIVGEESHPLARCRSLSSLSIDSTLSSQPTNPKAKTSTLRTPSYLARKLIFGKRKDAGESRPTSPASTTSEDSLQPDFIELGVANATGNGPRAWYAAPRTNETNTLISRPPPPMPVLASETAVLSPSSRGVLKHKGRSQSAPLPFSALDYVPVTSTDIFQPLPLFIKNYFDHVLPRELRLHILRSLVQVHSYEHERVIENGRWSVNKASSSRGQWVGKDRGIKELVKLSRVSKSWRSLVFDGQLWIDLDLHSFPTLPHHIIRRITRTGGPFIQTFNAAGHASLDSESLLDIASNLCLMVPRESLSYTQLVTINLQGCKALTTHSLHHLLIRSRLLEKLNVKGLGAVTNTTCEIIATYCPSLLSLNLSRCPNMDAEGIRSMANAALSRKEHLPLQELRLSGLKYTSDGMMKALGRVTPCLEVLDLSYARQMHNSALDAFVACDEDRAIDELGGEEIVVSARDLGREVNDSSRYRRRVTRIRHLNLSFCFLLTDTACANFSYSLPRLEFLELAGIGSDLKDAGLIRLLERTPFIKRLDLEDASDITDALLATITPAAEEPSASSSAPPQPGHVLQRLVISYAMNVSDQAMLNLIRNCPKLTGLEADNTRMGNAVLREFVRLSRERQAVNARIVAVDCRGIGENVVKDLSGSTRPRQGWRSYASRKLYFLDGRDENEEDLKIGQDECDESRVVLKTFYSWQTVDAVKANREKRKKSSSRRMVNGSSETEYGDWVPGRAARWWSPGGRRSGSGRNTPPMLTDLPNEGCRTM